MGLCGVPDHGTMRCSGNRYSYALFENSIFKDVGQKYGKPRGSYGEYLEEKNSVKNSTLRV